MNKKLIAILLVVFVVVYFIKHQRTAAPLNPEPINSEQPPTVITNLNDPHGTAADDVRIIHNLVFNFITAEKEPYRPPLGDNEDFVQALTGKNKYGDIFIPTNHPAIKNGQLLDRWGIPYHFHPRAPDAIDIRSAGPDKKLFTDDDIISLR